MAAKEQPQGPPSQGAPNQGQQSGLGGKARVPKDLGAQPQPAKKSLNPDKWKKRG